MQEPIRQLTVELLLLERKFTSSTVSGGIGSLTVTTVPFSDSAGNLTLQINGTNVGTIPFTTSATTTTISNINVPNNVVIKIINSETGKEFLLMI
jgi:hypothetical protein